MPNVCEAQLIKVLSQTVFPIFKYQVSKITRFVEHDTEEPFIRWIKSK